MTQNEANTRADISHCSSVSIKLRWMPVVAKPISLKYVLQNKSHDILFCVHRLPQNCPLKITFTKFEPFSRPIYPKWHTKGHKMKHWFVIINQCYSEVSIMCIRYLNLSNVSTNMHLAVVRIIKSGHSSVSMISYLLYRVSIPVGQDFQFARTSRSALGSTQLPTQWVPGSFLGCKAAGAWN
jgi:hypothetical protein